MSKLSFINSRMVFATNHGKVQAARDPFARILNATLDELVIDSDRLGTFSGETARTGSMLDALRGKVRLARACTSERFVIVSEGSFSSAGGFGLIAQNIEMLMAHDAVTGAEVLEQYVSWDTNYATGVLKTVEDLERFLQSISFGTHALVLYPQNEALVGHVRKGIVDRGEAVRAFEESVQLSPSRGVVAMSDMRAHMNPTRMRAIGACAELMASRLKTQCAECGSGGFGLVATVAGLPCEVCGHPTSRARAEKHACVVCGASVERPRSDGQTRADAGECERCNP
jgi:hypothetical protein